VVEPGANLATSGALLVDCLPQRMVELMANLSKSSLRFSKEAEKRPFRAMMSFR
jgi:hypothetical protein